MTAFFAVAPLAHADSIQLKLGGSVKNQLADAASTATLSGLVDPAGPGQQVTVKATVGNDTIWTRQILTKTQGDFSVDFPVDHCCQYKLTASTPTSSSTAAFNVNVPKKIGNKGPQVALLLSSLRDQGYFVRGKDRFTSSTGLALLAFRKVNHLSRTESYTKHIFKTLLEGKGAFPLQYPNEGKHVEADLSRQVMVFADNGKPQYTFPISSGKPSTPTVTGTYKFYLKTPG
jgi:hypothetical protein